MKYAKGERLDIGREICGNVLCKYKASENYDISLQA